MAVKAMPRSEFVTVMAWISLALGIAGVASGIVQGMMLLALPTDRMLHDFLGVIAPEAQLPPAMLWVFGNLGLLNFLSLLSSALFAAVSYGLLKRFEWGRVGFVLFLAASALAGLLGAIAFVHVLSLASGMGATDIAELDPAFQSLQSAMKVAMIAAALLVAILHGAIIWKLYRPEIRAEFTR
ncbi:hypothetical protein CSC74_13195 [Pseudoxanthomonas yeongjuensis]|uniref:hypothetical protein n=1 Tax=Pseudoxanthomonas yeongjuensis TaxID=377616 RepID=UPI001391B37F|nr:hypothetical protein [Pseudoxanthomonas yeongjuensis]KAF1715523.1 hypothetical protein CSC74_13195 [Pseudoxanthomonas yeongjuensis]